MSACDFKTRFCARYQCQPEAFERIVFRLCLYRRARPGAWLLRAIKPDYFAEDWHLVREVGAARELCEIDWAIENFFRCSSNRPSYLHNRLNFRVSGQRLRNLAAQLLTESRAG